MFRSLASHRFYHWTKDLLKEHNHTAELRLLGQSLLLTDDPENIKAVQDTQVSDSVEAQCLSSWTNRFIFPVLGRRQV